MPDRHIPRFPERPPYTGPDRRRADRDDVILDDGGRRITIDLTKAGFRRLQAIQRRTGLTRKASLDAALEAYAAEEDTSFSPFDSQPREHAER